MTDIGNLLNRPRFYHNIDGVGELGGSVMCLGFAVLLWLLVHLPASSVWHQASIFAFLGLMLVVRYGTKAIKTHITYPRTGFVEYRERRSTSIIAAAVGAVVPVGMIVAFRRHWDMSTAGSLIALVFAAAYAYHFARAVRWKWVVVWAMALGSLVIAFLPADFVGTLGSDSTVAQPDRAKLAGTALLCLMAYGTMLLISGGISFWLYLRHTRAPAKESQ